MVRKDVMHPCSKQPRTLLARNRRKITSNVFIPHRTRSRKVMPY